jgi:hypothetical protein
MDTQVYMTPAYHRGGELSTKVNAVAFGLVIIEMLTGYAVCSPARGHRDLLSMFQDEVDSADNLVAHLDKRACWNQHKQERNASLFAIAERCLEARRKKRLELVELIPELEEMRRGIDDAGDVGPSDYCRRADVLASENRELVCLWKRTSSLTGAELPKHTCHAQHRATPCSI